MKYVLTDTVGNSGTIIVDADVLSEELAAWFIPGSADVAEWLEVREQLTDPRRARCGSTHGNR